MSPQIRLLLAGALFATGGALIKSCTFPSLQRAGGRAAIAALVIFVLLPEARRWPDRRILRLTVPYFGATCLFVVANTLTTAANAIFLQSTATLWLVALGPWLLGERPHRRDLLVMLGVAVGMTLCFIAPNEVLATAPDPALGNWLAIASGISYALLLVGLRWLAKDGTRDAPAAIAWGNLLTGPIAFASMPLVGQTATIGNPRDWLVVAILGVFQVGLAYVLLVRAIAHVSAVRASLLLMIEPALSPLIAYAVHSESPHWLVFAGGATIIGVVVLGALRSRAVARPGPAPDA